MNSSTPSTTPNASPEAPQRRSRRWLAAVFGLVVVLVVAGGYLAIGAVAYGDLATLKPDCGGRYLGQDPSNMEARTGDGTLRFDATDLRFTDFTDVAFPSRDTRPLTIRGWYAPGPGGIGDPVVIVVHGKGSCRRDPVVLLPAGMLHRAGFGVLLIDMRDHGSSDYEDGRWAGGVEEYLDVLGAWDWLVGQGFREQDIGLFGTSLGAATVTIAMGEEPRVAATWADSSYSDFERASTEYTESEGWPGWVTGAGLFVGRIVSGDDLGRVGPDDELERLAGRPYAITHGDEDETVLVHHAFDNAAIATAAGTPVEPWIVAGAAHVKAIYMEPEAYEARLVAFFDAALGTSGG